MTVLAKSHTKVFADLVEKLEDNGYQKGFSLSAVPNDFRTFISKNEFAQKSLEYHIERMYELTGKPVVIIAHSFGNLVTLNALKRLKENNKPILNKIKKWIALAPPFAGATKAVEYFLHGIKDFDSKITKFDLFGQYMMLKSIPTVYELKPFTIFKDLFESEEYQDFAKAIRERLKLETLCRDKQCTQQEIQENSQIFNKYFYNYFPSLDLTECKYESSIEGNQSAFYKRCMTEMFNIVDGPSIVKVSDSNNKLESKDIIYNIEDYCDKDKLVNEERYFAEKCNDNKNYKCLDELYPEVPYLFDYNNDRNKMAIDYFINRFNNYSGKELNETINLDFFETEEEVKLTIKAMIEYQNNISRIKELPIPPVDIDIVYSSFNPTLSAEFLKKETLEVINKENGGEVNKGGDGTVPTWSPLLTAFKWIYEKKKIIYLKI